MAGSKNSNGAWRDTEPPGSSQMPGTPDHLASLRMRRKVRKRLMARIRDSKVDLEEWDDERTMPGMAPKLSIPARFGDHLKKTPLPVQILYGLAALATALAPILASIMAGR